jgi:trehalose 6-phosphate phosphatase
VEPRKPDVGERLQPFLASPAASAILSDFDGTLSPIVDDPATAGPLRGTVDALHALAARYGRVAVVSGRPVDFLRRRLELDTRPPTRLRVSGLYGLEWIVDGEVHVHPVALEHAPAVDEAATRAEAAAPDGVVVERKGFSLTLHVRTGQQHLDWARSWADATAHTTGLVVHAARMSFELRPPVEIDKGTVVADLVDGFTRALFLGDDLGDLPAFDALDRHVASAPTHTALRVGVRSSEAPAELIERADLLVDGPDGALTILRALLDGPAVDR